MGIVSSTCLKHQSHCSAFSPKANMRCRFLPGCLRGLCWKDPLKKKAHRKTGQITKKVTVRWHLSKPRLQLRRVKMTRRRNKRLFYASMALFWSAWEPQKPQDQPQTNAALYGRKGQNKTYSLGVYIQYIHKGKHMHNVYDNVNHSYISVTCWLDRATSETALPASLYESHTDCLDLLQHSLSLSLCFTSVDSKWTSRCLRKPRDLQYTATVNITWEIGLSAL